MPIYAYKCQSCGAARDVLQKISAPPLTDCPVCGAATFSKQLTAAGFQLKGSGWYVTDFRGGGSGSAGSQSQSGNKDGNNDGKSSGGDSGASSAAAASHSCGPSCGCA